MEKKDISTNTRMDKKSTSTTYTPINPEKPMITPDGRTSINAKIEDKQEQTTQDKKETDKTILKTTDKSKEKEKSLDLKTDKPNPWKWGGIVIVVCFALYFASRWFGVFSKKRTNN